MAAGEDEVVLVDRERARLALVYQRDLPRIDTKGQDWLGRIDQQPLGTLDGVSTTGAGAGGVVAEGTALPADPSSPASGVPAQPMVSRSGSRANAIEIIPVWTIARMILNLPTDSK